MLKSNRLGSVGLVSFAVAISMSACAVGGIDSSSEENEVTFGLDDQDLVARTEVVRAVALSNLAPETLADEEELFARSQEESARERLSFDTVFLNEAAAVEDQAAKPKPVPTNWLTATNTVDMSLPSVDSFRGWTEEIFRGLESPALKPGDEPMFGRTVLNYVSTGLSEEYARVAVPTLGARGVGGVRNEMVFWRNFPGNPWLDRNGLLPRDYVGYSNAPHGNFPVSLANAQRIRRGVRPVVDAEWMNFFGESMKGASVGEPIDVVTIGSSSVAFPVPRSLVRGYRFSVPTGPVTSRLEPWLASNTPTQWGDQYGQTLRADIHARFSQSIGEARLREPTTPRASSRNLFSGLMSLVGLLPDILGYINGRPDSMLSMYDSSRTVGRLYMLVLQSGAKAYGEVMSIEYGPNRQILAITYRVYADYGWDSAQRKYVGKTLVNVITQRARDASGQEIHFSQSAPAEPEGFVEYAS